MTLHKPDARFLAGLTLVMFLWGLVMTGLEVESVVLAVVLLLLPALLCELAATNPSPIGRVLLLTPASLVLFFASGIYLLPLASAVVGATLIVEDLRESNRISQERALTGIPRCPCCGVLVDPSTRHRSGAFHFYIDRLESEAGGSSLSGSWLSGRWPERGTLLVQAPDGRMANVPSSKVSLRPISMPGEEHLTLLVADPIAALGAEGCLSGRV